MSKKCKHACLAMLLGLMALGLAACDANVRREPPAAAPADAESVRQRAAVDALLGEYATVVERYLAAAQSRDEARLAGETESLGAVSLRLSEMAVFFNAEQQKRYEELTARLNGE